MNLNHAIRKVNVRLLLVCLSFMMILSVLPAAAFAGQVTLTWDAPTTNADGTPLSNFNGAYRIYYGTSTGNYTQTTNLTNTNSVVTCPVTNLTDNQAYYFVVTAVNTLGNESQYSNEVSKSAQPAATADTTAPTVSLSAPANGATFAAAQTVAIKATAADAVGVTRVEFYDGTTLLGTDTTSPYSWSWAITSANNGSHSLTARAYDAAANVRTSAAVSVTVNIATADTTAPTVSLSAPANGATFAAAQTVAIKATAADAVGVTRVEFYDGTTLLGTDTTSPYSWSWAITSANNGSHSLTARAYDAAANVRTSAAVSVTVNINTYSLTATAGANGTVTPTGATTVNSGAGQAYSITPAAGYHVANVLVDGVSAGAVTSYSFSNVTANHTISVSFAINITTYSLTATAGANGTVTPSGATTVNSGAGQAYSITPAAGYHVANVLVDGVSAGAVTSYSFSNVTANHTISATFAINTYSLTATAGANGTVTPSGATTVNSGAGQAYSITPAAGYHVANVLVDGVSAGAVTSYSFSNVTANHTISATFAINTYSLTATAGANGTVTPSGATTVNSGAGQAYSITPAAGYHVANVLVDGVSAGAVTSYSFSNVTANHTISATFANVSVDRQVCLTGCQYNTIQQAIDDSGDGDIIKLAQGEYHENIVISESRDFTLSGGWGSGFTVQSNNPYLTIINGDVNGDGAGDGSAVAVYADAGVTITGVIRNLVITKGKSVNGGGVEIVAVNNGSVELTLTNNVLTDNAAENGGGISTESTDGGAILLAVMDTMIVDNTASYGGGIDAYASGVGSTANITLTNDTLSGNVSLYGGGLYAESIEAGDAMITAENDIIWGNTATEAGDDMYLYQNGSSAEVAATHSDIGDVAYDSLFPGTYTDDGTNMNVDPVFINPAKGNYRINSDSPCRDKGASTILALSTDEPSVTDTDFEGDARPQDAGNDIGADEYKSPSTAQFKLLSLNGGEIISAGTPYNITWTAPSTAVYFTLQYSINKGKKWITIVSYTKGMHYRWPVNISSTGKTTAYSGLIKITSYKSTKKKISQYVSSSAFTVLK